jgi:hypothetical protein
MRSFKKYLEVNKPIQNFRHNEVIPTNFAMAVHRIMHNKATADDWETLDKFPKKTALLMIQSILTDNNTPHIEKEMQWWLGQL